jgi:hypothetical protein
MRQDYLVAFSWEMLIAPAAALAGVGITAVWTSMRETTRFHRELYFKHEDESREVCAAFLTSIAVLEQRESQLVYILEKRARLRRPFTEEEVALQRRAAELVADLRKSLATLDLVVSPEVREAARRVYKVHASFEDVLREGWNNQDFDIDRAWKVFTSLEEAREALVEVCRQQRQVRALYVQRPRLERWAKRKQLDQ